MKTVESKLGGVAGKEAAGKQAPPAKDAPV